MNGNAIRIAIAVAVAGLHCLVPAMTRADEASEAAKSGEKIILPHGWRGMIQLQDLELARAWPSIRQLPFNGLIFRTANWRQIMRPEVMAWESWQQELDELTSVEYGHFTDNFLWLGFSLNQPGTTVDWFDDWEAVRRNLKNMARVAKLAGMKGFVWDPEGYTATPHFAYPDGGENSGRTRAEYEARVRRLGEQIMSDIREIYPDITIMTLFGYSTGDDPSLNLLPSFLDGLLAASDPRFVLIDGQEGTYYTRDKVVFANWYGRMRGAKGMAFKLCNEKDRWAKQGQAGFGLFVTSERNGAWQSRPDLLDMNYFSPAEFKRALVNAANQSDRYVWLYTEAAGWLDNQSDWYPYRMARVYLDIVSDVSGVPYKPTAEALAAMQEKADGIVPRRLDIARLPKGVKPPTVDGDLSDNAWTGAVHIPSFVRSRTTAPLPETGVRTEAWVTFDSDHLYVAYRCHEPDMPSIVIEGGPKRDSDIYRGDNVELWLTPGPDLRPYYQLIINPDNVVYDGRNGSSEEFDGAWRSAVRKGNKSWQVELSVPWSDLKIEAPEPGTTLRANLNRLRRGRPEEVRRWHAMGYDGIRSEVSSWSQYDRLFTEVANLGYWTFK
ncbi:MAG: hypothetical protein CMJ18_22290 [Phycisphaeraceae bacterium]|nr:hypothetical protein [Phycisphaeraceae bacterium]